MSKLKASQYQFKGIDVSYAQGKIDWEQTKLDVDFAMLRIGFGVNNMDKWFLYNVNGCYNNGIHWGGYYFSYALNPKMAESEADYCYEMLKNSGHAPDMPIAFDFEYASANYFKRDKGLDITNAQLTEIVKAFCAKMESYGFYTMVYCNKDYYTRIDHSVFKKYARWYAYYQPEMTNDNPHMWQYYSYGQVRGVNGTVDLNVTNYCFPLIIHQNGLNRI